MKVACIILTYNRLSLLQRCIESVRSQTYKEFDIWVVDNASSDGTFEWLNRQEDLHVVSVEINEGAANGFNIGLKSAYDDGADWFWIMDDDGVADVEQLNELVQKTNQLGYLFTNALVCDIDNPDMLAFGLAGCHKVAEIQRIGYVNEKINPFNGTFINRVVIEQIGYIEQKMYLYGCEIEYTYRAIKKGLRVATITSALHYHHRPIGCLKNIIPFFSRFRIVLLTSDKTLSYYMNMGYIHRKYRCILSKREKLMPFAYVFYFVRTFKFKECVKFVKCYYTGIVKGL